MLPFHGVFRGKHPTRISNFKWNKYKGKKESEGNNFS